MKLMTGSHFGISYLWKDKTIEEPFIKALLDLSFEYLQQTSKG